MVLYYNSNARPLAENSTQSLLPVNDRNKSAVPLAEDDSPTLLLSSDVTENRRKLYTNAIPQLEVYPENKGLLENLSDSLFGQNLEFKIKSHEEILSNLSTDEKIDLLFKINVTQNNTTTKHLRIILFLLLLIIIKLYS